MCTAWTRYPGSDYCRGQGAYPVRWTGREAVVTLPEHIDGPNATQISEHLIPVYPSVEATVAAPTVPIVPAQHRKLDRSLPDQEQT
jgi:hypothetical protein